MNDEFVTLDSEKIRADYAKLVEKYPHLRGTKNDQPILGTHIERPIKDNG